MSPSDDPEAQTGVDAIERQLEDIAEKRLGEHTITHLKTQGAGMSIHCLATPPLIYLLAENYGESSGGLWSVYLTKAQKDDKQTTKKWTEDTGGVLIFVSSKTSFYICFIPKPKR